MLGSNSGAGSIRCSCSEACWSKREETAELHWSLKARGGSLKRREKVGDGRHDDFVSLVVDGGKTANQSVGGAGRQGSRMLDFRPGADLVAWTDGLGPAHLFHSCADHTAGYPDRLHALAHGNGRGQPSRGRETVEK